MLLVGIGPGSADYSMSEMLVADFKKVGQFVFTSGITGEPGDPETQIRNIMKIAKERLAQAGASVETVFKVNVFLSDITLREKYLNQEWKKIFPNNPPLRTTVQVGFAEGIYAEIEFVALVKS
jgi:enamine deaminase RidA (YjgF/YER057c/UK114 family)